KGGGSDLAGHLSAVEPQIGQPELLPGLKVRRFQRSDHQMPPRVRQPALLSLVLLVRHPQGWITLRWIAIPAAAAGLDADDRSRLPRLRGLGRARDPLARGAEQ